MLPVNRSSPWVKWYTSSYSAGSPLWKPSRNGSLTFSGFARIELHTRPPHPASQLTPTCRVIAHDVRPAAHARLVVRHVPGPEDVTDPRLEVREVEPDQVARPVDLIVRGKPALGVAQVVHTLTQREAPPGRPGRAALGDDLDDAVRGLGAVQGRGRGALHYLHALDVVGVEVFVAGD